MAKRKKSETIEETIVEQVENTEEINETVSETTEEINQVEETTELVEEKIEQAEEKLEEPIKIKEEVELVDKTGDFTPVENPAPTYNFKHGELVFINGDKSRAYSVIKPCEGGFYVLRSGNEEVYTSESMMMKIR